MTLKMTTAQVVETSVTVNSNSPIQDYVHPDNQTQPTFEMTPGFKPFTMYKTSLPNKSYTNCAKDVEIGYWTHATQYYSTWLFLCTQS